MNRAAPARAAIVVLLAVTLVAGALGTQAAATFAGGRGRLAYAGFPDGADAPEIFTRKKDGTGIRRLTRTSSWDSDPVWSPAGTHLAWSCHGRTVKSDPPFDSDICVIRANGRGKKRFRFKNSVKTPDFAPNGKHIAYASDGPNDMSGGEPRYPADEIWVMRRDGTHRTRVTDNRVSEAAVSWSPAGGELAFVGIDESGGIGLYLVDLQTGEERQLTTGVAIGSSTNRHGTLYTADLDWSPDGERIVFSRLVDDATDVFVVDTAGQEVRVTDDPPSERNTSPAWAPDGESIVYRHAGEGSSGPGWTCLAPFPLEEPVSTNHDDCPGHGVSEFDFSWQARRQE